MNGKTDAKGSADLGQGMWINLPRTGQVLKTLDGDGVTHVTGVDPDLGDTPYCVQLGFSVGEHGLMRYGTSDSVVAGDYFYAEVQKSGLCDIHLKAQSLGNQGVTIMWWAIPLSSTSTLDAIVTIGPTPSLWPGRQFPVVPLGGKDLGRSVEEVPGIDAKHARRLTSGGIKSLDALARANATDVARVLNISEVRAMDFIDQARRLVQGKSEE